MKSNLYQDCYPKSFADGPIIGDKEPKIPLTTDEKIEVIKDEVSKFRRITFEEADKITRMRPIVQYRQEIMKFVDEFTPLTLKAIGSLFKQDFDHTTILHAKTNIKNLAFCNKRFEREHELIRSKILSRI